MKPLLISSGEPAGIGPDLCLELADDNIPAVVIGDMGLLKERATLLGKTIHFADYQAGNNVFEQPNQLLVWHHPCKIKPTPGVLEPQNARYVLDMLETATDLCLQKRFAALVTAPINKAVINQAGFQFSGHTEFLAQRCNTDTVVMMLACPQMKVALATTHLPLRDVAEAVTEKQLRAVILCLNHSLQHDFGLKLPKIGVAGLNPHAGESGYLGREEIDIIIPVLDKLREQGIDLIGPLPADTMFTRQSLEKYDAFVAMYHDQGLPVLKYAGFGHAVNITLGLPIIRTSVDHGTALELAGKGTVDHGSFRAAVDMAITMVNNRTL